MLSSSSPAQATKISALADAFFFESDRAALSVGVDHGGLIQMCGEEVAPGPIGFHEQRRRTAVLPGALGQVIARLAAAGDDDALLGWLGALEDAP